MSNSRSIAALALGAAAIAFAASPASAASYPSIGASNGPYAIIQVSDGGGGSLVANIVNGTGVAYDTGNDDVYYGIENLTASTTVLNITLSGTNIFGFENDGIGAGPTYPASCGTTAPCTTPSLVDNSGGGYGGPISTFSLVDASNGSVFFGSGLGVGDFTWFALEAPINGILVTGINTANTPLPAALPMFAGGLGVMGLLARRRKRKAAAALAT
jgi:hypothetical protein